MAHTEERRRWIGLIAVALGVALIVVDTTIVNVITPAVIADLGVDSSQAQWVQEGYTIVFAALLLLTGRLSDLWGSRRVFLGGVAFFAATSILAGFAGSGGILIAARLLQGVGAAAILPASLALLNHMFTGKARGTAFAVWGTTIGAATAVGPVLGGWLAESWTWRWAFGINVPLTLVILAIGAACLSESPRSRGGVDGLGAALSIPGLGALAFGLVEGRTYGWFTSVQPFRLGGSSWDGGLSPAFVALLASAGLLTAFAIRQTRLSRRLHEPGQSKRRGRGREPLMDTTLFGIGSFRNGNIATVIIGLGEFGIIAVLPLWLQFTLGYSSLGAGAMLVAIAAGSFAAGGISFPLAEKGAATALDLVRAGLILELLGLAALGVVAWVTDASWWLIAATLFVYGIGVGLATAQVTNVVLEDIPEEQGGQGAGIQSTFRQLGSALGIAILTTVFFSVLNHSLRSSLEDAGSSPDDAAALGSAVTRSAGAAIEGLGRNPATAAAADAAREAMTHALALGSGLAAVFLLVGVVATAGIPNKPRGQGDVPVPDDEDGGDGNGDGSDTAQLATR